MENHNYDGTPTPPHGEDPGEYSSEPLMDWESVKGKLETVHFYFSLVDLPEKYEWDKEKHGIYLRDTTTEREVGVEILDPQPPETKLRVREYQANGYPKELGDSEQPEEVFMKAVKAIDGVEEPDILDE